jgi:hypothetical protein
VALVESAAHALEKALKRYAACRKDEVSKAERVVVVLGARASAETGGSGGGGAAVQEQQQPQPLATKWIRLEQKHNNVSSVR